MTTPHGKVHTFASTGDDRPKAYTPPGARAYHAHVLDRAHARIDQAAQRCAARPWATTPAGRLTSEDYVQSKRTFAYDGEQDRFDTVTRELADGAGKQSIEYAYDGSCPRRWSSRARRRAATSTRSAIACCRRSEKLTVGAHRDHPRAGVRRRPPGDQDRPVLDRAHRPGRRGLEDHRRQAVADLRLRRQRPSRDAHVERSAAPSASSRSSRSTTAGRASGARSAWTAARRTRSPTATTAPGSC